MLYRLNIKPLLQSLFINFKLCVRQAFLGRFFPWRSHSASKAYPPESPGCCMQRNWYLLHHRRQLVSACAWVCMPVPHEYATNSLPRYSAVLAMVWVSVSVLREIDQGPPLWDTDTEKGKRNVSQKKNCATATAHLVTIRRLKWPWSGSRSGFRSGLTKSQSHLRLGHFPQIISPTRDSRLSMTSVSNTLTAWSNSC